MGSKYEYTMSLLLLVGLFCVCTAVNFEEKCAQVRSCMEYCFNLWDGSAKHQVAAVDSVDPRDKKTIDRYIIACHSTDFECFRRQYMNLRDHMLLGNNLLGIPPYEPYTFEYGDNTCIRLSGLEKSELSGISYNSTSSEFSWTLELPFKLQQILSYNVTCVKLENDFMEEEAKISKLPLAHNGSTAETPLNNFTGNASIQVKYPFVLRRTKPDFYMILSDEKIDVILDIPDLSDYNVNSQFETQRYKLSEWAYTVVQRLDAAQQFALPYTSRFDIITGRIPMRKLFLLYPDEDYQTLHFSFPDCFTNGSTECYNKSSCNLSFK